VNIDELRKKARKRPIAQKGLVEADTAVAPPSVAHSTSPLSLPIVDAPPATADTRRQRLEDLFSVGIRHHGDADAQLLAGAWNKERATDEEFRQMLAFSLGSEEYALDIQEIREIIKPREITDIPRVPEFILGIISLRGIVIPVFDLKRRFNLGTSLLSPSSRIIVCQRGDRMAGLLVDSIAQVVRIPHTSIEPPPPVLSGLERELLEGVGRYQGRMIILLNMSCVLNTDLI
jgi:purine-binding chemotaxis protein CheW